MGCSERADPAGARQLLIEELRVCPRPTQTTSCLSNRDERQRVFGNPDSVSSSDGVGSCCCMRTSINVGSEWGLQSQAFECRPRQRSLVATEVCGNCRASATNCIQTAGCGVAQHAIHA